MCNRIAFDSEDSANTVRCDTVPEPQIHGSLRIGEVISELADRDDLPAIGQLIGDRLSLRPDMVEQAFESPAEEPTTVLCRAAGVDANGFSAVLRMRRRRHGGNGRPPSEMLLAFRQLPLEGAQRVVKMLKVLNPVGWGEQGFNNPG